MPVEFLSDEQAARYGRYHQDPPPEHLARWFYLSEPDHAFIAQRRRKRNRLGCAVQLCTLRYLGTFLPEPTRVPRAVIDTLAAQLQVDPDVLQNYRTRVSTGYEHQTLILAYTGLIPFSGFQAFRLTRWLYAQVTTSTVRPSVLFDLATAHLVAQKIVLPGVSVLTRLVARVRERVSSRTFQGVSRRLTPEQQARLEALLVVPEGERLTPLEVLRTSPTRITAPALLAALVRIEQIREVGVAGIDLDDVPQSHRALLARHAQSAWAQTLSRMGEDRRLATLLIFVQHLERSATDDALELFDGLMTSLALKGETRRKQERLRTLKDLDQAALVLQDAARVLLDAATPDLDVRRAVFALIGEARLSDAASTVRTLASEDADPAPDALSGQYTTVRRFLPTFLRTVAFEGASAARPLLDAWNFLAQMEAGGRGKPTWSQAPRSVVPKGWERRVFPLRAELDHQMYTLCVLDRLQQALKRREVFVPRSVTFSDPRAELLQGPAWEAARDDLSRALGRSLDPAVELDLMGTELNAAYLDVQGSLATNTALQLELEDGHSRLRLTPLEAQPDAASLQRLRDQVALRLPQLELSTLLLEVHALTGFAGAFTHLTVGRAQMHDLPLSLCAVLLAQACNIGLKAVARPDVTALTLSRLSWVQQNYVRPQSIEAANARLVDAQLDLPLAQVWGGGEVASADGMRFVVPVRTISAGWNRKYFGSQRGVTYYNFTSDQFTGFHGIVIPGTLRDSLSILAGLLEQQTRLDPREIMSDTHGSSDVVFGLFSLLGYRFSPRLADLPDQRFWRMEKKAEYGVLSDISRHTINQRLITAHWDDLLRLVGSLKLGSVKATAVMRTLQRGGSLSGLGRAVAKVGRIEKTLYLLNYVQDESYRRRILVQLNRGARPGTRSPAPCFMDARVNCVRSTGRGWRINSAPWGWWSMPSCCGTRYIEVALAGLKRSGAVVSPLDVARLSPLLHEHVNMLGKYDFTLPDEIARGMLRPLRDPDSLEEYLAQIP